MRWILLLIFSGRLFAASFEEVTPSTPEEILSLTSNLLVGEYVSVLSGQISLSETDLYVKGAQDLCLKRTYVPPQILGRYEDKNKLDRLILGKQLLQLHTKGWVVNPHLWAGYNPNSDYFQVRDPAGFTLEFAIQGNRGTLKSSSYGCSNLRGDEPSSSTDIRNITLCIEGEIVKVTWPTGIQRLYRKHPFGAYRLEKELLPNGKSLRYEYNPQGFLTVTSCDLTEKWIYGSIVQQEGGRYISSHGKKVVLNYEMREIKGESKSGSSKESGTFRFPVMSKASNPFYPNAVGYNERTLLNYYDAKNYPISCSYFQEKNVTARVQTFSTPSGSISFSYDPPIAGQKGGSTTVVYPDGAVAVYRFNNLLLLEAIENWFEGKLVNQKIYHYDSKQHIQDIETRDGAGSLLIAKRFECDDSGNPLLEKTEGDFGVFSIQRKFDKNRLIFEAKDDGLETQWTYLGDTHLITSKTIFAAGEKVRKTLYTYDESNNLVLVEEEGKTRTRYTLYQSAPHLHRPELEEQTNWDGTHIHKIHYFYDQWGNTATEEHFGADESLAYTIYRTYNEKGELLEETNPLGETAYYNYDPRGHCIYEEPIANDLVINRTFDAKGRLVFLQENEYQTKFAYNSSDELIEKTDYLGYTTKYRYQPVHNKPDWIEEPPSTTQVTYDSFGREIETKDAYGASSQKEYNGYGRPLKITDPDGGVEFFTYFPNGRLKSHIDPDGLETTYYYDGLGRCIKEKKGELTTVFEYDGYDLRKKTDAAGFVTEYDYDQTGHKIKESRDGRTTQYGYDSLGFLNREERGKRKIEFANDSLGRLLRKTIDGTLETAWTYDRAGNISSVKKDGITAFLYDSHNRLIQKTSPEGHITSIVYEVEPQILLKNTLDPLGIETLETYNPQGQLLSKKIAGQLVESFAYDRAFRLASQDHLAFGYTPGSKKAWLQEAGQRTSKWVYTPSGSILTKEKPDGTNLLHSYDTQGRLTRIGSTEFRYDTLNRIVGGTGFSRTLDAFGNVRREEWTNGLWIETDYDAWDRPIERRLPDLSRITYQYEGPFLKKVIRFDRHQREIYSHIYEKYDRNGNPLIEQGVCTILSEYDPSGRKIGQNSPYFEETIEYDPAGNLIRKGSTIYTYDALSQMTSESGRFTAAYDAHYNLRGLNGRLIEVNGLNQIKGFSYDLNGNLLKPGFAYDEFDQLIEAEGETYVYDALGRRIQKGDQTFLYFGDEEVASFENGNLKELKISGVEPVAIEIQGKPYEAIADVQGTIRLLIDPITLEICARNSCDAFGTGLEQAIPYAYLGKRSDAQTGLIYFGKRYYDPLLRRWLTSDPIGPVDHSNLYQYLFNNSYSYRDLNGEFAFAIPLIFWGAELALPTISACVTAVVYGAAAGAVVYSSYKVVEAINENNYSSVDNYYSENLSSDTATYKDKEGRRSSDEPGSPPHRGNVLGDGTKRPDKGYEWKGAGKPGSSQGNWVRGDRKDSQEILHPDLDHKPPVGSHWDYEGPAFPRPGTRLYPDGTWEYK